MMNRLTEMWEENGQIYGCFTPCKEKCLNNHKPSCRCDVVIDVMKRLAQYENTGLTTERVQELKEKQIPKPPVEKVNPKYKALGKCFYCKCGVMLYEWDTYEGQTNFCGNCGQRFKEDE